MTQTNLTLFFGHLHPLMVHLPIGFLAALAVLELADRIGRFKHAAQARGVILTLTIVSTAAAVALGLMLASAGGYDPKLLAWHKWTGITLAALCVVMAITFLLGRTKAYGRLLLLTLLCLGVASHFGGSMTHGTDYLTQYAPTWLKSLTGQKPVAVATAKPKITDLAQANAYADVVQPILEKNCTSCHGPEKQKGELRLDSLDAIHHGGHSAGGVKLLVDRILLPTDDSKHMPPPGRPQMTEDQLAVLQWWAESGTQEKKVGEMDVPVAVADAMSRSLGLPPASSLDPLPMDQIAPALADLNTLPGLIITQLSPDQPLLNVNASTARSFGDAELAKLAPIARNIAWLNLAGTKITDAGLAPIAQMPNLTKLRLDRTAATDAAIPHLTQLRHLDYLNLYATKVTDASLTDLKKLPALHHLYLWKTQITPAAAQAFAASKTDQTKITRLKTQIASLQSQIQSQTVEVVEGLQPPALPVPAVASTPSPAANLPTPTNAAPAPVTINKTCPITGKPIDSTKFVDYKGKRIAFCCGNCPAEFQKDPAKYADKLLLASTDTPKPAK